MFVYKRSKASFLDVVDVVQTLLETPARSGFRGSGALTRQENGCLGGHDVAISSQILYRHPPQGESVGVLLIWIEF